MDQATSIFLDQGVMGAAIVVLGAANLYQYHKNNVLQREKLDLVKEFVKGDKETITLVINALNAATASSNATKESIDKFRDKIELVQRGR